MRETIRKILRENKDYEFLKRFLTKNFEKQINSGEIPKINISDLKRKGLGSHIDDIINIYFDFVGGPEEAFKLFKQFIEGKIVTDDDLRKTGINVHPEDQFKVKITRIYNPDYRGKRIVGNNEELEFGFDLLDGQFETSDGILTLEELYSERYDDIWLDVTDYLRSEIEGYVQEIAENNFGLYFKDAISLWV